MYHLITENHFQMIYVPVNVLEKLLEFLIIKLNYNITTKYAI